MIEIEYDDSELRGALSRVERDIQSGGLIGAIGEAAVDALQSSDVVVYRSRFGYTYTGWPMRTGRSKNGFYHRATSPYRTEIGNTQDYAPYGGRRDLATELISGSMHEIVRKAGDHIERVVERDA